MQTRSLLKILPLCALMLATSACVVAPARGRVAVDGGDYRVNVVDGPCCYGRPYHPWHRWYY